MNPPPRVPSYTHNKREAYMKEYRLKHPEKFKLAKEKWKMKQKLKLETLTPQTANHVSETGEQLTHNPPSSTSLSSSTS
jgi:hypothetical protein